LHLFRRDVAAGEYRAYTPPAKSFGMRGQCGERRGAPSPSGAAACASSPPFSMTLDEPKRYRAGAGIDCKIMSLDAKILHGIPDPDNPR
jgi:hypothetical protein